MPAVQCCSGNHKLPTAAMSDLKQQVQQLNVCLTALASKMLDSLSKQKWLLRLREQQLCWAQQQKRNKLSGGNSNSSNRKLQYL